MFVITGVVALLTPTAGFSQNFRVRGTVVEVRNGSATIVGTGSSGSRQARPGAVVNFGDLIRPGRGVIVVIQCGERQREIRSISGLGDVCPDSVASRYRFAGGSR
jgi:hypothetical protein